MIEFDQVCSFLGPQAGGEAYSIVIFHSTPTELTQSI
jgi:hypothetical protein